MTGTLHEDRYTFFIISRTLLLKMRNVSDKICKKNQNTYFMFNNFFFFENRTAYEIMWKRFIASVRLQMIIWRMRIAYLTPLVTNTLSEYTSPIQQWLHELPSMLRYKYIYCHVLLLSCVIIICLFAVYQHLKLHI
jgi:hypothetical protein